MTEQSKMLKKFYSLQCPPHWLTDHSSPCSLEVSNESSSTSTHPYTYMTCTGANLSLQNQVEIQHTTHANQSSCQNSKLLQAHILTCHQIQVISHYMISVYMTLAKTWTELNNKDHKWLKQMLLKITFSGHTGKKHCSIVCIPLLSSSAH